MKKFKIVFEEKFMSENESERKNNFLRLYNEIDDESEFEQKLKKNRHF